MRSFKAEIDIDNFHSLMNIDTFNNFITQRHPILYVLLMLNFLALFWAIVDKLSHVMQSEWFL